MHEPVPWIVTTPKFTVLDAHRALGRTFAAVNNGIARLRDLGIVEQIGESQRSRLFAAPRVIEVFEAAPLERRAGLEDDGPER